MSSLTNQITSINGQSYSGTTLGFENLDATGLAAGFGVNVKASTLSTSISTSQNADVITGAASGTVTITAGAGNDVITLGAAKETLVYGSTATANGVDSIASFTVGTGATADVLNFQGYMEFAAAKILGQDSTTKALSAVVAAGTGGTTLDANVFVFDGTATELQTATAKIKGDGVFGLADGKEAIAFLTNGPNLAAAAGTFEVVYMLGNNTDDVVITSVGTIDVNLTNALNLANFIVAA